MSRARRERRRASKIFDRLVTLQKRNWNEQGLTRYERDARLASGLVFLEKLRTGEGEEK